MMNHYRKIPYFQIKARHRLFKLLNICLQNVAVKNKKEDIVVLLPTPGKDLSNPEKL